MSLQVVVDSVRFKGMTGSYINLVEASLRNAQKRDEAQFMARRIFYSFHYKPDSWRAGQIREMGLIEGNRPATDNDWETITRSGDEAIKRWIADQMTGTSCTVVLIGENTANRKWINHEIIESWKNGKGLVGIYIHNLKDREQSQSIKGSNPFDFITFGNGGARMSSIVRTYDPPYYNSKIVYDHIKQNLADWVEEAIRIRNNY
jgi:hypothetical protein